MAFNPFRLLPSGGAAGWVWGTVRKPVLVVRLQLKPRPLVCLEEPALQTAVHLEKENEEEAKE